MVLLPDVFNLELIREQVIPITLEIRFLAFGIVQLVIGDELPLVGGLNVVYTGTEEEDVLNEGQVFVHYLGLALRF